MKVFVNAEIFIGSNMFTNSSLEMAAGFTNVARKYILRNSTYTLEEILGI